MTAAPALVRASVPRSAARAALNRVTRERFRRHCRPLPRLTLSEWAERHRVLSPEATANHGPWRNDVAPYLVPIMDAITDRSVQEVTVISPSQAGKSELILNAIGYFIHQEPSPILVVQPTVETGESFSKDRVAPMLRDTPVLRGLVRPVRSRDSNNTVLSKGYPGGQLDITGANAPAGLAMRPKRVVLLDERDRHPRSAGTEGDVKGLARARTRSYRKRRKVVEVSSPTTLEESLIYPSYLEGTQEITELPCLACGAYQPPRFEQLRYDVDDAGKVVPASVRYRCDGCGHEEPAARQREVRARVRVRPTGAARVPHKRSFWIHGLVAAFHDWVEICQEFVTADRQADPSMRAEMLRTFFNTTLGELYRDLTTETVRSTLLARARPYAAGREFHVPREAALVVAGWDVQHDRAEGIVRAFGVGEESWLIERAILRGDTSQPAFWLQLEEYRTRRTWRHESGAPLTIRSMTVDAGDGARSADVYRYCAPRLGAHVFAVKGHSNPTAPMLPAKHTKVKPGRLYVIGVHAIMERLYRRLSMDKPGPGYLHLNEYAGDAPPLGVPPDYVDQLLSMERVRDPKTRKYKYVARKGARVEVADGETYAYAALLLGPVPVTLLAEEVARVNDEGERLRSPQPPAPAAPAPVAPPTSSYLGIRGSWMGGLR